MKKILSILSAALIFSLPFNVFATSFNPAVGNNSPMDGLVESDTNQSFATARAATTGVYASATDNTKAFVAGYNIGGEVQINRSVVCFDTSSIPDNATITSATESIYLYGDTFWTYDYYSGAAHSIKGRTGAQDYMVLTDYNGQTNTIDNTDYDNFGSTKFSNNMTYSGLSLDSYNTFTLNSSGIAHINKTGITCFGMRNGNDFDNVAYASGFNVQIWGNDSGSPTVEGPTFVPAPPVFSVVYSEGTTTPTPTSPPTPNPSCDNATIKAQIQTKIDELQALVDQL